jgi:glycosyltransferase involved in cell wall biosynthesis
VIDARPIASSTGRYQHKLIENLSRLDKDNRYTVLVLPVFDKATLELPGNFKFEDADFSVSGSLAEQTGLLKQINGLNADLVHFTMPQQPVRYKGLKLTTIHDLTTLRFENPAKNPFVFRTKQLVYGRVLKRVARESAAVITPSKFVKQDVAQYANISLNKIAVTYEAADKITATPEPIPRLKDKQFIMYVGRATPHKNLARLVEAFALLNKKYPDLMLALAGKMDKNYKRIEALATEKRLAHRVVFTDFVSEGELRWMYENTAAYVFPSLSEGFGLPSLEAMMHGAPVVSSSATCLPEINGEAAVYFDPEITFDIAKKISGVLSDPKLRCQLIRAGHAQAAKYSWRDTAKKTLDIYNKALEHYKNT